MHREKEGAEPASIIYNCPELLLASMDIHPGKRLLSTAPGIGSPD